MGEELELRRKLFNLVLECEPKSYNAKKNRERARRIIKKFVEELVLTPNRQERKT